MIDSVCDSIQTRCNASSWTGGMISSSTKGITCISSEEDFQISQRNIKVWAMVFKRKGYITTQTQIRQVVLMTEEAPVE
jgi:hypothetical protein